MTIDEHDRGSEDSGAGDLSRKRRLFLAILSFVVVGLTGGIAWVAATSRGVAWQPAALAVPLGVALTAWLFRYPAEGVGSREDAPSVRASQHVLIVAGAGVVPVVLGQIPATWQVAALTFMDAFLAACLMVVVHRLRREHTSRQEARQGRSVA